MYLIIRGVVYGNIIGIFLIFLQKKLKIINLDPNIYYVDNIPISIEFYHLFLLNTIIFSLCLCSILIPSFLVSKINPKDTIKFN